MDSALQVRLAGMPQTPDEMLSAVSESLAARTGRDVGEVDARSTAPHGQAGQLTFPDPGMLRAELRKDR
jgi:hypothetical protein